MRIGEQTVKLKGRGGIDNFANNKKTMIQTEAQREVAKQLLGETLDSYRMPKVQSDEELAARLDAYFSMCATDGIIPCVEDMCMYTGYAESTIWDWETGRRGGFSPATAEIIKKGKDFLKTFDAKMVISGALNFLTYCFRAKNYYGMVDKQELVLTPNQPLGTESDPAELQKRIERSVVSED